MSPSEKASCKNCVHFRSAPYEARIDGCFLPANMDSKQSASYLDEQQIPGDHMILNRAGKCTDFEAKPTKLSFLQGLIAS